MNTPKQGAFTSKLKKLSKDLETVESEYLGFNREKFDLFKNREFLDEFNEVILKIGKCLAEQVKFSVDESADEDDKILSGGKKKSDSKPLLEKAAKELIRTCKVFNTQIKELKIDDLNIRKIKWHQLKVSLEFSRKALLKLSEAKVKSRFAVLNSETVKTEVKGLADSLFDIFNSFKSKYEAQIWRKKEELTKLLEEIEDIRKEALKKCREKYKINTRHLKENKIVKNKKTHYGIYLDFKNENYKKHSKILSEAESLSKVLTTFESIRSKLGDRIVREIERQYNIDTECLLKDLQNMMLEFINIDNKYYNEFALEGSELLAEYGQILEKNGLFSVEAMKFIKKLEKLKGKFIKKFKEKIKSDEEFREKVKDILIKAYDLDELDRKLKNILD